MIRGLIGATSTLLAAAVAACSGPPAQRPDYTERIRVESDSPAVRAYEFTGYVQLRVESEPGDPPRRFTINGVSLSTASAAIEFDGEQEPPVLWVSEGALMIHDPVHAAPGAALHGAAGFVLLKPGQRLVLSSTGPRLEPGAGTRKDPTSPETP